MPTEGVPNEAGGPADALQGRFDGRLAFQQIVRDALRRAAEQGWRELILCDASFEDWPLNERVVAQALQDWSRSGRHCTLLARRFDSVQRTQHRFVTWRRTWAHIIECRACPSAEISDFPSAIWSPSWAMERLDPVRSVGVMGAEPVRRVALRERLDEWLLKSSPSFAASTLGL